mgnify:CR=1 FL=1
MRLYFKYKNPDNEKKKLNLTIDVEENRDYTIKSGDVHVWKAFDKWEKHAFDTDGFSKVIAEQGFDENDIRIEIEETLENIGKDEIV